jgi:putative acetyltransferase
VKSPKPVRIRQVDPRIEEAQRLIVNLDRYQSALYPAESNHLDSLEELASANVVFVVAYQAAYQAFEDREQGIGCGAVKIIDGTYGEIKRLYVSPLARGAGVAKAIIAYLEQEMLDHGIKITRLETGIYQTAAIELYKSLGYKQIGPFGTYKQDPLSVFMEKHLTSAKANSINRGDKSR